MWNMSDIISVIYRSFPRKPPRKLRIRSCMGKKNGQMNNEASLLTDGGAGNTDTTDYRCVSVGAVVSSGQLLLIMC